VAAARGRIADRVLGLLFLIVDNAEDFPRLFCAKTGFFRR